MLTNVVDLVSDYMARTSSDSGGIPTWKDPGTWRYSNLEQLKKNERCISTLMTRKEREEMEEGVEEIDKLWTNPLFPLRKKRKRIEEFRNSHRFKIFHCEINEKLRVYFSVRYKTPDFLKDVLNEIEHGLSLGQIIRNMSPLLKNLPKQAEEIVSDIEKALKDGTTNIKTMSTIFARGVSGGWGQSLQVMIEDHLDIEFIVLGSLLILKAVEMGAELTFSFLEKLEDNTSYGEPYLLNNRYVIRSELFFPAFNINNIYLAVIRDTYIPPEIYTLLSDMREGETLLQMATRIWGEDETKTHFLYLIGQYE